MVVCLEAVLQALIVVLTVSRNNVALFFEAESFAGLEEKAQILSAVVKLALSVTLHHAPAVTAAERVTQHVKRALAMALSSGATAHHLEHVRLFEVKSIAKDYAVGICFEFDVKATAVNFLHNEDATVSHAVRCAHVQGCLVFIYQCVGQIVFRCKHREALAKAFARFVFKHEEDFGEKFLSHLLEKTVF